MKIDKKILEETIRKEIRLLTENMKPTFNAQVRRKPNNIVAAIYFAWNRGESNNSSFWSQVIQIIQQNDCILENYVVTDSICEFEFSPSTPSGQDELEDAKNRVIDSLKELSSQFTNFDVYIVGN